MFLVESNTLFQSFVNVRARLPRSALEVYAAEITHLTQEAFPGYNDAAIQMEHFRHFVAGLYLVLRLSAMNMGLLLWNRHL